MLLGPGLLVGVALAASAGGERWMLPGIVLAGAFAAVSGWYGKPTPVVHVAVLLALAAMLARTFAAYLVPDQAVLASVAAVAAATVAVALGASVPQPARRLLAGILLGAAAALVAVSFAIEPPERIEPAAYQSYPTGPLFPAVALFGLFTALEKDASRHRMLGRIVVGTAAACAVAWAVVHQLGAFRLGLSDAPMRDALAAADAAPLSTLLNVVVVLATLPALVAVLAAVRDGLGELWRGPAVQAAGLGGAIAAVLAALFGPVITILVASTLGLAAAVFGLATSSVKRFL